MREHPCWRDLIAIVTGRTSLSSGGYPYISGSSFLTFVNRVPHLFRDGQAVLDWLGRLARVRSRLAFSSAWELSMDRAVKVIQNMVFTAGITAPPDLWLLRQVLSVHREAGITDYLLGGQLLEVAPFSRNRGLQARQLEIDLHFLHARGLVRNEHGGYRIPADPAIHDIFQNLPVLPATYRTNMVRHLCAWLHGGPSGGGAFFQNWLSFQAEPLAPRTRWFPNRYQMELGYRLLPLILAMRALDLTRAMKNESILEGLMPGHVDFQPIIRLFEMAGLAVAGRVSELGNRVFSRGPGPFGIIGAYDPYLQALPAVLQTKKPRFWVNRGENVAASQDANRKTFKAANDALDTFCKENNYRYNIFIEHAVGKGEATRQRFERSGEGEIHYFGADLEDAAINEAVEAQRKGVLPQNMQFIRGADIGKPERVLDYFREHGFATEGAVMMVGNGFHEIREQTNEKMLAVFRAYQEAGILSIFTEETALSDRDLLNTAWNTYHAGFRYVHEMSGQGLRPSWDSEDARKLWGWRQCAERAGYRVLDRFTHATRTIYPFRKPKRKNPSISLTYFCVPRSLVDLLNLDSEGNKIPKA